MWTLPGSAKGRGIRVEAKRIRLPALPQCGDDVDEFLGTHVPVGMGDGVVDAEVASLVTGRGGHHVPSRAASADVLQRGEGAGQRVRMVVTRRRCGNQSDAFGRRRDRRQQGDRLEHLLRIACDVGSDGEYIREEHRVQQSTLGDPRHLDVVARIEQSPLVGARVPPRCFVVADAHHEGVQMQLSRHVVGRVLSVGLRRIPMGRYSHADHHHGTGESFYAP